MNRQQRRAAKKNAECPPCAFRVEKSESSPGGVDLFVVFNGMKIARRGYPDSPQAKTWVSLEPGYVVTDISPTEINVEFNGTAVH